MIIFSKGVILPESIKGSNVFGSIEAAYPTEVKVDHLTEIVLYNIAGFMKEEQNILLLSSTSRKRRTKEFSIQTTKTALSLEMSHRKRRRNFESGYPGYYYGLVDIGTNSGTFIFYSPLKVTQILVYGTIFENQRNWIMEKSDWFGTPVTALMYGFWVGAFLFGINGFTELFNFEYNIANLLFWAVRRHIIRFKCCC